MSANNSITWPYQAGGTGTATVTMSNPMQTNTIGPKLAAALLKAQRNIGAAVKGSKNPFFKSSYADLGSVMEACKEQLNNEGITVLQPVVSDGSTTYVETVLVHESGEQFTSFPPGS